MISFRTRIAFTLLSPLLLAAASGTAHGREVEVSVPFCVQETRETDDYKIEVEYVPELVTETRTQTIPGYYVVQTVTVPYTAYRYRSERVAKVVKIARTIWRPVTRWVRKVRGWFQRTWLGRLVRRVTSWMAPVTRWVKRTTWDRVVKWVNVTIKEPYTAYRTEQRRVWVPPMQLEREVSHYELVKKERRIPITITVSRTVYRKTTVDGRDIPVSLLEDMFRSLPACDPLEERLQRIYAMWREFKASLSQYANAARTYNDAFYIYQNGVPYEGWPAEDSSLANGFGQGPDPWGAAGENLTYPDGESAAQYFRLDGLADDWGWPAADYPAKHTNLCGELAVIAAVGDHVRDGLTIFHATDSGREILRTNAATGWWDLETFFGQYDRTAQTATGSTTSSELAEELRQAEAVIALANLDTWSGHLAPGDGDRYTAHWVTVLEVLETRDRGAAVRVYNPLQNREEYYSWEYFYGTWERTEGNSSSFVRVTAQQNP